MRRFRLTCVLVTMVAVVTASTAFGQALDGTWLRMTVKATGFNVDDGDDSVRSKGAFRSVCYMFVEHHSSSNTYQSEIACEIARNVWSETPAGPTFTRFSDEGGFAFDENAHFTNRQGHILEGAATHILSPTYNRRGVLVKVKLTSYGEVNSNTSTLEPGATHLMGGYTVTGTSVPEKKVPDAVVALLDDEVASAPPAPPPGGGGLAADVLALVNANRASGATCGSTVRPAVGPLALNNELNDAASVHALDMATNDFFDHEGSDGSSPFQRIAAAGYTGGPQGENIAAGYVTAASVVAGWMTSPGHCNNIMNGGFSFLGVGYAFNATSTYGYYWVQTFGG